MVANGKILLDIKLISSPSEHEVEAVASLGLSAAEAPSLPGTASLHS